MFTAEPLAKWFQEMLADYHERRTELIDQLGAATHPRDKERILRAIRALEAFLDLQANPDVPLVTGDSVVDRWEAELAQGKLPEDLVGAKRAKKK